MNVPWVMSRAIPPFTSVSTAARSSIRGRKVRTSERAALMQSAAATPWPAASPMANASRCVPRGT